ncbi:helicase, partial [Rugamonas sp. FT82W]
MRYTPDDVRRCFDSGTYGRGAGYYRDKRVLETAQQDGRIKGKVSGSSYSHYRQSIKLVERGRTMQFEGDCDCPVGYNCKHVVAVLLAAFDAGLNSDGGADDGLPYEMSSWLSQLDYEAEQARRQPSARPAASKAAAHRLIYVLMPQAGSGHMRLHLCKGRIAADGEIRSATSINDLQGFQQTPPAYVRAEERTTAAIFLGLTRSAWGAAAMEPVGPTAANLLRMVAEAGALYLAANSLGLNSGLLPLHAGPARTGGLGWNAHADGFELGWAFDDGAVIDRVLPTSPPTYVADQRIGQLDLPDAMKVLPMTQWLSVLARAPTLSPEHVLPFAEELLSSSMNGVLPLPRMNATLRTGLRPTPVLTLHSATGPASGEFGLLAFDYDGLRVCADEDRELVRVGAGGIETIARHEQDEAAAWSTLRAAGFDKPAAPDAPRGAPPPASEPAAQRLIPDASRGELRLASESAWLRFVVDALPALREQGWQIEMSPGFRFDLSDIDDWYARIDDNEEEGGGHAWLELELGIVVDGAAVPLLPVLLQLIRQAPRDFEPAALDARGDDEALLAALPGGARV